MFLQWRQDTKAALSAPCVVIADITLNHLNQGLLVVNSSTVAALTLQKTPESFHGAVVDAVRHAGHTLCHTGLFNFVMERTARVLVFPVAVEQRMCVGISLYGQLPDEYGVSEQEAYLAPLKKLISEDSGSTRVEPTIAFDVMPALRKKPNNAKSNLYLNPYDLSDSTAPASC